MNTAIKIAGVWFAANIISYLIDPFAFVIVNAIFLLGLGGYVLGKKIFG